MIIFADILFEHIHTLAASAVHNKLTNCTSFFFTILFMTYLYLNRFKSAANFRASYTKRKLKLLQIPTVQELNKNLQNLF